MLNRKSGYIFFSYTEVEIIGTSCCFSAIMEGMHSICMWQIKWGERTWRKPLKFCMKKPQEFIMCFFWKISDFCLGMPIWKMRAIKFYSCSDFNFHSAISADFITHCRLFFLSLRWSQLNIYLSETTLNQLQNTSKRNNAYPAFN